MNDLPKNTIEAFGSDFTLEEVRENLLKAQQKTWEFVKELSGLIVSGMNEKEAIAVCDQLYIRHGIEKKWHKNRIRFGANTLLAFKDTSDPDRILKDDDIYFIDIGPVVDGFEGDCGDTIVLGNDPEKLACAKAARELFRRTQTQWRNEGLSGEELYKWATLEAERMGWVLNLNLAGHRVSEFPHALHHKGSLNALDFTPALGLWILEIQIRHPEKAFGAFYEDILN